MLTAKTATLTSWITFISACVHTHTHVYILTCVSVSAGEDASGLMGSGLEMGTVWATETSTAEPSVENGGQG